ncbi:MAG: SDR family NAD(P)-dependent oxidoreductase, partial [Burkholderiales bacterium]
MLIHGGAGGVGLAAIQVAKMLGAEIFATVGTEEKRGLLALLGVEHIYDSRSLSFADEIELDTNGVGVDVILNSLSGEAITHNLRLLKPGGRFIELGKRDFLENTKVGIRPFRNNISYFGVDADQLMSIDPNLTAEVFSEVMTGFARGDFRPLPYETFDANDIVEAFRYMQHSHQIGKIVVTYDTPIKAQPTSNTDARPELALDPNGAYLVTGGLGGFGLKCAQWLAGKGAKTIVLAGRRGVAAPDTAAVLERLAETGVQVITRQCDVSDFQQVASLIDELEAKSLKLRGIVHAAMVIEDALCRNVTAAQLEKVLSPKVRGAKNLHLATTARGIKLDFFLLCSSATTLFG